MQNVVEISGLTRRFRDKTALDNVEIRVPAGSVFGLVGENGAGKTTLIKHILGSLRAQQGQVRVFGIDPVADPVNVLGRIGYVSEESDLPAWMTVDELMKYMRAFYKSWDESYAETLRRDFMTLWNTGRFDDIRLETEAGRTGLIVRFVVTERRVIRSIDYPGAKSVTVSEILDRFKERKVGLSVESQYDPNKPVDESRLYNTFLATLGIAFFFPTMGERLQF